VQGFHFIEDSGFHRRKNNSRKQLIIVNQTFNRFSMERYAPSEILDVKLNGNSLSFAPSFNQINTGLRNENCAGFLTQIKSSYRDFLPV